MQQSQDFRFCLTEFFAFPSAGIPALKKLAQGLKKMQGFFFAGQRKFRFQDIMDKIKNINLPFFRGGFVNFIKSVLL